MPDVARGVFDVEGLALAERYAALLADAGVVRGLIGPREVPRLWDRHLLNSAVVAPLFGEDDEVADIGSGAGLPGVVLAIARPDLAVVLVEPLLRRATFLEEVVAELGLANIEVVRARAEELHGVRDFDAVTARAVAPLSRLLGWCLPLVRTSGRLVALKGSSAPVEIEEAAAVVSELGCEVPELVRMGEDVLSDPTWVVQVGWPGGVRPVRARKDRGRRSPRSRGGRRR